MIAQSIDYDSVQGLTKFHGKATNRKIIVNT